jgi:hypothetical protein
MMTIWAAMRAADYVKHQSAISLESGGKARLLNIIRRCT